MICLLGLSDSCLDPKRCVPPDILRFVGALLERPIRRQYAGFFHNAISKATPDPKGGRFYREPDHVRLQPANAAMEPIRVKEGDLRIQGVVVGVLRKY